MNKVVPIHYVPCQLFTAVNGICVYLCFMVFKLFQDWPAKFDIPRRVNSQPARDSEMLILNAKISRLGQNFPKPMFFKVPFYTPHWRTPTKMSNCHTVIIILFNTFLFQRQPIHGHFHWQDEHMPAWLHHPVEKSHHLT